MFDEVARLGFEGIMAKKSDSPYRTGRRSADWLKIPVPRTVNLAIVGHSPAERGRTGFGALHLASYDAGRFVYAGRVGTGFGDKQLAELAATLGARRRPTPPCEGPVPKGRGEVWVEPELVCEVRYKEWTAEGLLRQPVFLRLRDDVKPAACPRPAHADAPPVGDDREAEREAEREPEPKRGRDSKHGGEPERGREPEPDAPEEVERRVSFTNLTKVFWPDEGYTKGDLIEYYRRVSRWLLPYLVDRPVVLTRYPDGIRGKSFFQKDAPGYTPAWIRTETMWSEQAQREIGYFICDDEPTLLYLANMATIPLHVWSSRLAHLQAPDWCVLDLDPKGAPFAHVVQVAETLRDLCESIELPSFVKTSGSTGLHVLVPLGRLCTYEQSRQLGELIARVVVAALPEITTIERVVSAREGRVYIDYLQNGHGRLIAAPYSVRPLPGATVSTPLDWSEVGPKLDPSKFTIKTAPERFDARTADPMRPVIDLVPDLVKVLEGLARRLSG